MSGPEVPARLFVSVDITGSTAFKATRPTGEWLPVFQTFFERFPIMLIGPLAAAFHDHDELPPLDLWKAGGDELIFEAPLQGAEETGLLLGAVAEAAARYAGHAFDASPLSLKVTAWTAAFPPNARMAIPEIVEQTGNVRTDFIGPDIDLGFRLASHARPGSVLVSLSLATHLLGRGAMAVMADGVVALRGVAGGAAYPLLRATALPIPARGGGLPLTDATMLEALAVGRACTGGEGPAQAIEALFVTLRRKPADPARAFDLALAMLGGVPSEVRATGHAVIAAAGPDHPYHGRHHLAEAILSMGWLCATARTAGAIEAEEGWLGVLAMAGHDLGHDGSRCVDGRLEWKAALAVREIGVSMGLEISALNRVQAVILETAPGAVVASSRQPPGCGPAGLLGSLAREADVTASLMPRLGWHLSLALRREWGAAADPAADGVAGFAGRLGFLSLYAALSPAAREGLGLAAVVADQRDAFDRVGERLDHGLSGFEAAKVLDTLDRRSAIRIYRAALSEMTAAGGLA